MALFGDFRVFGPVLMRPPPAQIERTPTASSGGYGRRRNRGSPVYGDQNGPPNLVPIVPARPCPRLEGGRLNRAAHAASASPDQAGRARLTKRRATVPVAQLGGTGGVEPRRPNPRTSPSEASPCGYLSKKITTRLFLNSFASSPASTAGCVSPIDSVLIESTAMPLIDISSLTAVTRRSASARL